MMWKTLTENETIGNSSDFNKPHAWTHYLDLPNGDRLVRTIVKIVGGSEGYSVAVSTVLITNYTEEKPNELSQMSRQVS